MEENLSSEDNLTVAQWVKRAGLGDWIRSITITIEEYERLKDCESQLSILREMILQKGRGK